jgi:hypothetical protein
MVLKTGGHMRGLHFIATLAVCAACVPSVKADQPAALTPAEIPFANHGGIYDWKADGENAILIKSLSRKYYRATFMSRCIGLPFAQTIGFVTTGTDTLDKFGSILLHHENCQFQSFEAIPKPDKW